LPKAPVTKCTATITRLPVMWAVNNPPRARKQMTSTAPAIVLRTASNNQPPRRRATHDGTVSSFICTASPEDGPLFLRQNIRYHRPIVVELSGSLCVDTPMTGVNDLGIDILEELKRPQTTRIPGPRPADHPVKTP